MPRVYKYVDPLLLSFLEFQVPHATSPHDLRIIIKSTYKKTRVIRIRTQHENNNSFQSLACAKPRRWFSMSQMLYQCFSKLPPTSSKPSKALIRVWQVDGSFANGPTESSLLGMVKLNGSPFWEVNVMSITAGRDEILSQEIPYAPFSLGFGLMSGEMRA